MLEGRIIIFCEGTRSQQAPSTNLSVRNRSQSVCVCVRESLNECECVCVQDEQSVCVCVGGDV